MILPGQTIGIVGGGQLGRMTGQAARRMGYGFVVLDPQPDAPARHVADRHICAPYEDEGALRALAESADVVAYEFENIAVEALQRLQERLPVRPDPQVLGVCQHRGREKRFLQERGFRPAPFAFVDSPDALPAAIEAIGVPCVLKTAQFGYDGKGQQKIESGDIDAHAVWKAFGGAHAVLEKWMPFEKELSVVVARDAAGTVRCFPVAENVHTRHILDISLAPARVPADVAARAQALAADIAEALDVVGLLAAELFLLPDGALAVNELAPRPHNSGHYTLDACVTSQFEQFLRAVCGLPLGSVDLLRPVAMVNLLGDSWSRAAPPFDALLQTPDAKLHLYGKSEPRPGRKMGHFCVYGEDADDALRRALDLKRLFS